MRLQRTPNRNVWVAISTVVNAIRVLERMVPAGHLLFDHYAHDLPFSRAGTGSVKLSALRDRVEDFVTWANHEAARHGIDSEAIPDDPHGAIGLQRFRRTLAWHIARRPGGLVALAIQYGHMRTAFDWTTEGYASRSRMASTTSSTWRPPAPSLTPSPRCTTTPPSGLFPQAQFTQESKELQCHEIADSRKRDRPACRRRLWRSPPTLFAKGCGRGHYRGV